MDAAEVQCIQQGDDIFCELLDRVRSRRDRGLSVASGVIAQDPKLLSNLGNLWIPHGIIGAKRIREHQHGCSTLTFQRVMNSCFSRLNDGHRAYSSPAGILPRLAATARKTTRLRLEENGSFSKRRPMLDAFENKGNSLAHTDAHGAERISAVGSQKLIEGRGYEPRAAGTQGVAESNGTTVWIHVRCVVWNSQFTQDSQRL